MIYCFIPTQENYEIWVSVLHCAWHPLMPPLIQVSWATFLPLFLDHHHHHLYFSGREEIYPLVPASISPFYWVFNCWRLGFQMLGHIVLLRGLFKKVNTWRNFVFFSSWNHACCFFCFLFCLPSFFSTFLLPNLLCKWPQPNSQRIMGVNC